MTTTEIYQLASETTQKKVNNLLAGFNNEEARTFERLVRLGDSKELALWTVIAKRDRNTDSEAYRQAYTN